MNPTLVFIHYLECLEQILVKIEVFQPDSPEVLHARLADDMFPLAQQAKIAAGFSLRACCPLAGLEIASFDEQDNTIESLKKQIAATIAYLKSIPEQSFENFEGRVITTQAGFAEHEFNGHDYYLMYALPNFLFHLNMVYAIARNQGVPLSKADYDGYHQYPQGFSF